MLFHLIFPCYYCSIDLKRQSEHSGPRPDTSSLVHFYDDTNFKQEKPIAMQVAQKVPNALTKNIKRCLLKLCRFLCVARLKELNKRLKN